MVQQLEYTGISRKEQGTRQSSLSHEWRKGGTMGGLFGGLFDFNKDGKMSTFEKAAEFATIAKIAEDISEDDESELESVGLDKEELKFMDDDERREAIEDAGLDPDDYDFD